MSEPYQSNQTRSGRRLRKEPPKSDHRTRRWLLQLTAVLIVFALWLGLCRGVPAKAAQWREALSELLTSTQDLWDACRQLGEDLAQGEAPANALGDWCTQVFLPASLQQEPPLSAEGEGPH